MDIRSFAKKLRHAADVLEALVQVTGTPELADKIRKSFPKNRKHWTQTPVGKRKMAAAQRRVWKARKEASNA